MELERGFIASLLAHAFFSTFPKRTIKTHPTLQDFNFTSFFKHLDMWVNFAEKVKHSVKHKPDILKKDSYSFFLLHRAFLIYVQFTLWSSGQRFWLQIQRSRVRFLTLPDFLSSSGPRTGSTQPREVSWGTTSIKSSGSGPENRD